MDLATPTKRFTLTRVLLLIWLALGGLLVLFLCFVLSGAFRPSPKTPVLVGEVSEYPPGTINLEFVNVQFFDAPMNRDLATLPLLVVHGEEDDWTVFLARSTRPEEGKLVPRTCVVEWNESLQRLLELCGGSQWKRDGTLAAGSAPRDLDRFPVHIVEGKVFIDLDLIQGSPR